MARLQSESFVRWGAGHGRLDGLAAADILVILELFTGTPYLLMIATGLAVGELVALAGTGWPLQVITAGVIGVLATSLLHRSRFGCPAPHDVTRDRNVNPDIGRRITEPALPA